MDGDVDEQDGVPPDKSDTGGTRAERLEEAAAKLLAEAKAERQAARKAERAAKRDGAPEPAAASGSPRVGWVVATAVTATLLVLALVAGSLWIVHLRNQNDDLAAKYAKARASAATSATDATRTELLVLARSYAVDFASFDYQHLDADFARSTSHLTPGFATYYQSSTAKLKATVVELKGRSVATVHAAAVQTLTATSAVVLLFVDQSITSSQSSTPRVDPQRMKMTLVRSKGTWLVSALDLT